MPRREEDVPRRSSRVGRSKRSEGGKSTRKATQGWGAVARRQAEVEERREEAENAVREFWLKDGESAQVQFLQDEPYCYDAHSTKDSRGNWKVVPCQLNTGKHCVMCSSGMKQVWRAAFMVLDLRGTWNKEKSRFNNDKPIVKIWKVNATIAQQLKQLIDKKGRELSEMVLEVSRSGSGKSTSYNFEIAFDDDDRRVKPIDYEEDYPDAEELCQPPSTDEVDERGYVDGADD